MILGQGMRKAGWHADTLNAPGKFLISAPGHDTPRRARACLITDDDVRDAVARCTPARPELDPVSSGALSAGLRTQPRTHSESGSPEARSEPGTADARYDPDVILRRALSAAPAEGIPGPGLRRPDGARLLTGSMTTTSNRECRVQVHRLARVCTYSGATCTCTCTKPALCPVTSRNHRDSRFSGHRDAR